MRLNEIQTSQLLDQARAFANEGKTLHAEQVYRRLINEEPTLIEAHIELASLYAEAGNVAAGISVLAKAHALLPEHVEITFLLGTFHLRAREYDKAITQYQKLTSRKLPHVHFNMGIAYFSKGNFKRAEEQLRLTLKLDPKFPKLNESIGELLTRKGSYAEAIQYLKRGIALDPYSWVSHHLLGVAYHAIQDLKNAYNEFVLAIEMDPNEAHSWQKCGEVLLEMKRVDEAERYLLKALELDPQFADALANVGQLYLMKGDPVQSTEYFNRALSLDPTNARAKTGRIQSTTLQKK
jgi:protein O-GlcNAc transferase